MFMILHLSLAMAIYHNLGHIVEGFKITYLSIYCLIICPLLNATTSTDHNYGIAHHFGTCGGCLRGHSRHAITLCFLKGFSAQRLHVSCMFCLNASNFYTWIWISH